MDDLLDPLLDARFKGYPPAAPALRRSQIGAQGWHLFDGRLPLPLAVLKREALVHNLAWMQRVASERGVALAPHGKTTMSPQLFGHQVAAGAWGISFANVQQLGIGAAAGVRRALIANQVLQPVELHALAALLKRQPDLRAPFLVDSLAQVELIESAGCDVSFEVLVELGMPAGRTGVRDDADALALARRIHHSSAVRLAGVEAYEGLWAAGEDDADRQLVEGLLLRMDRFIGACAAERLFEVPRPIVSAGGSAVFDLVADALGRVAAERPLQALLRSGCYVTHDDGAYQRYAQGVNRRLGCSEASGLHAALEVWAVVQSCPEPRLALLSAGKRDVSADWGLPVPLKHCPAGAREPAGVPAGWSVDKLNDQHAYLRVADAGTMPHVGDRVGLGISHPCTTFDKWRWMAVVDAHYRVVDAISTCF